MLSSLEKSIGVTSYLFRVVPVSIILDVQNCVKRTFLF